MEMVPATQPFHYEYVQANGLRFRVATAGSGEKLALLLHGFPEFSHSWRFQIPLLARLGYRVWAPDLRGYGGSDAPDGVKNYRISEILKDIAGLIDAAGAESVTLVGHDWGAYIAWNFAIRKVRPLDRLVIMNVPHPGVMERAMGKLNDGSFNWAQLRRSWYMFLFQIPRLPEALSTWGHARWLASAFRKQIPDSRLLTDEDIQAYRDNACLPGRMTKMMNYYRAMLQGDAPKLRKHGYPVIETPTLMLWGDGDIALGKELTYGTDRFVRNLSIRYLPGISHLVQQHAPGTVNAMLKAWLAGSEIPEAHELGLQRAS